jgi:hypothetical protein
MHAVLSFFTQSSSPDWVKDKTLGGPLCSLCLCGDFFSERFLNHAANETHLRSFL